MNRWNWPLHRVAPLAYNFNTLAGLTELTRTRTQSERTPVRGQGKKGDSSHTPASGPRFASPFAAPLSRGHRLKFEGGHP